MDPQPFRPVLRGLLLTGSTPRYMSAEVSGGLGEDWRVSDHALWWPPSKIAGRHLSGYLALRAGAPRTPEMRPSADIVPVHVELADAVPGAAYVPTRPEAEP